MKTGAFHLPTPVLRSWPDMPDLDPGPGLRALLREAGGLPRVLPGYLSGRPWRRGLLLSEYLGFGLQDQSRDAARTYLGAYGAARLALDINRWSNRRGLVGDKLLLDAVLRGSGLAVPDLVGVFGRPAPPGVRQIGRIEGLRALFSDPGAMPVFGKPAQAQASQDAIAATGYDAARDSITMIDGRQVGLGRILDRLQARHRGTGFLFQRFIEQHPDITAAVGPAVATVRLVTLFHEGSVHILIAGWKVPRAGALADTPQRGALAARVDPQTGAAGPIYTVLGPGGRTVTHHPDTGALLDGRQLPHWTQIINKTRRAAGLVHQLPLIGWDIAIGTQGPVFVEANTSMSLDAFQALNGHGILAGEAGRLLLAARRRQWPNRWGKRRAKWQRRFGLVQGRLTG
jgi:hypothetical protein